MDLSTLILKLKERNILTKLSIFGASAWFSIQIAATTSPFLGLSKTFVTSVIWSVIVLIPSYLIYLWFANTDPDEDTKPRMRLMHEKVSIIEDSIGYKAIALFSVVGMVFLTNYGLKYRASFDTENRVLNNNIDVDKMAVLHFVNMTGKDDLKVVGPMAAHWITEGFIQNGDLKIVSTSAVQKVYNESGLIPDIDAIRKLVYGEIGASHVIDGSYFLQGDSIFLNCQLLKSNTNEVVYSFGTFSGSVDEPIKMIENLREQVLGYWYNRDKIARFPAPRYDAYKKFIEAQAMWGEDDDRVLKLLQESTALDPDFYEPRFLELALYRNANYYSYCDSLLTMLNANKSKLTKAQLDKVYYFGYELNGDYKTAFEFLKNEYDRDPQDLFMNTSIGQYALFNLNDPSEALDLMDGIDINSLDFNGCHYCQTRLFSLAVANIKKENYSKSLSLSSADSKLNADARLMQTKVLSLVQLGKVQELNETMKDVMTSFSLHNYLLDCTMIATEYYKMNNITEAQKWVDKGIKKVESVKNPDVLTTEQKAKLYELDGDYKNAEQVYLQLATKFTNNQYYKFRLAGVYAATSRKNEAVAIVDSLLSTKEKYDFGYLEYEAARIYTLMGDQEKALDFLQTSLEEGRMFYLGFFDRDWYFRELWSLPEFQSLIKSRRITTEN